MFALLELDDVEKLELRRWANIGFWQREDGRRDAIQSGQPPSKWEPKSSKYFDRSI